MLGFAQRRDFAGQAHHRRIGRAGIGGAAHGEPFGDREHRQRRAFVIGQHQVIGVRREDIGGHVEGDGERPLRAVGQRAALRDRGHVGGVHEAVQRREHPRGEQLEIGQLCLAERAGRPRRQLSGQFWR